MGSVKSCYGHTEGAAGLTGALLAHAALMYACRPAVMHLRNPNAYVEAALQDWRKSSNACGAVQRQRAPSAVATSAHAAGSSSFGMSGINAHVILLPPKQHNGGNASRAAVLLKTWCWPAPPAHVLLQSIQPISGSLHFACSLQSARLAYLRDCKVGDCQHVIGCRLS